jgi:hypothetical protein
VPKPQVGLVGQLGWCIVEGSAHQQKVLTYFNETEERRQQFVVVEVERWGDENVTLPLRWVTRSDLNQLTMPTLLTSEGQLKASRNVRSTARPSGAITKGMAKCTRCPRRRRGGVAHANARAGRRPPEGVGEERRPRAAQGRALPGGHVAGRSLRQASARGPSPGRLQASHQLAKLKNYGSGSIAKYVEKNRTIGLVMSERVTEGAACMAARLQFELRVFKKAQPDYRAVRYHVHGKTGDPPGQRGGS